jgi:ABC-type Na+ transport system ATPase subunit NatA
MIEAAELAKRFGEVAAVDGISFQVQSGEFFGFLGPNGAGKTTTINMLIGLARPDAGSIRIGIFAAIERDFVEPAVDVAPALGIGELQPLGVSQVAQLLDPLKQDFMIRGLGHQDEGHAGSFDGLHKGLIRL